MIEFDELYNPSYKRINTTDKCHSLLSENNYSILHYDGSANFLYYREAD